MNLKMGNLPVDLRGGVHAFSDELIVLHSSWAAMLAVIEIRLFFMFRNFCCVLVLSII